MNKKCARPECGKTVYPLEELKCLDKVWHKQCFKCSVCGMALSMKNYKGYNKMPYCEAHYPKTVASVVSDTPEMRRLAENTKNQSLVKYHAEFEKMKGSKIQIADDPEVQRHMKNTTVQSQALYHGEIERKEMMEKIRPPLEESSSKAPVPGPMMQAGNQNNASPYTAKIQSGSTLIYSSEQGGKVAPSNKPVGSIADYDPLNGQWGSAAVSRPPMQNSQRGSGSHKAPQQFRLPPTNQQQQLQSQNRQPQQPQGQAQAPSGPHRAGAGGLVVRAMYDYSAADSDEVSFAEGDVIVGCQQVDEGWLTGTVQRSGQWGMLPANYVERVH